MRIHHARVSQMYSINNLMSISILIIAQGEKQFRKSWRHIINHIIHMFITKVLAYSQLFIISTHQIFTTNILILRYFVYVFAKNIMSW